MTGHPRLWHFTCADHGHRGLGNRGLLKPRIHFLMPQIGPVVWLTRDGSPDRVEVGLTSTHIRCDRMAYRYRVVDPGGLAVPWSEVRDQVSPQVLADLESFADPSTWWLASEPIEAVLA
jgi:hypothetical protein